MATVQTPTAHIWVDDEGRAWIDDTKIKVIEVALDKIAWGLSPDEIHEGYPRLSLAQIHAALSYYYDYKDAFDRKIQADQREVERLRVELGPQPVTRDELERRLREKDGRQ